MTGGGRIRAYVDVSQSLVTRLPLLGKEIETVQTISSGDTCSPAVWVPVDLRNGFIKALRPRGLPFPSHRSRGVESGPCTGEGNLPASCARGADGAAGARGHGASARPRLSMAR